MQDIESITALTEKQKERIIRIGKSNDNMNKYYIKISAGPVCVGIVLILLAGILDEDMRLFLWGMGFFVGGFAIPMIWPISLAIRASACKYYSYERYQELIGAVTIKNIVFQPDEALYPRTTKLAQEMFDGDVNKAITYVMCNIRGDELDQFVEEWTPEQAAYAMDSVYREAEHRIGKEGVDNAIKEAVLVSKFSEDTGIAEEDLATKKNPYAKKLAIHSAIFCC